MKSFLVTIILALFLLNSATAQKRSTVLGDTWSGEVQTTNETTQEITIQYVTKDKTETFTGVLRPGRQMTKQDGSNFELKISDIPIGMRVRLFAKSKEVTVGGQKTKVYEIWRIQFLGRDEYAQLRAALNLDQNTSVQLQEASKLPKANPLKIHALIADDRIRQIFEGWVAQWNKEQSLKSGSLDLVPTFEEADATLVVLKGSPKLIMTPFFTDEEGRTKVLPPVTAFLVRKKENGLEVLWKQLLLTSADAPISQRGQIEKEMEKRLKARM